MDSKENDDIDSYMRIDAKADKKTLRFVSFNVNGAKTIFQYHPWNQLSADYDKVFQRFRGDIISLQELKLTSSNVSSIGIGNLSNYRSFISVSKHKRGYSGVGLFIRKPLSEESDSVRRSLQVVKAEEGLTGSLSSPDFPGKSYSELDSSQSIGGYPSGIVKGEALKIDSEGRCVVIELACNIVIFSVYCPANSINTEEGETTRLRFLSVLLERSRNIKEFLGKEVVIMGDINVSLDMIDHADYMNDQVKQGLVTLKSEGSEFERLNHRKCIEFKYSTPARALLNSFVFSTLDSDESHDKSFLYDTTRHFIGRRMNVYTVWNTRTGARQSNYGSRIDLVLTSSEKMLKAISNSGIWPFVLGSDHCPVFTDFESDQFDLDETEIPIPRRLNFEAQNFFKLVKHQDIASLFGKNKVDSKSSLSSFSDKQHQQKDNQRSYSVRKPKNSRNQRKINDFFTITKPVEEQKPVDGNLFVSDDDENISKTPRSSHSSIVELAERLYGKPPKCFHGKPCKLKTSMSNKKTKGKKYWSCSGSSVSEQDLNANCNFFQWTTSRRE